MKPWTREDTQLWINQLENRIEDIEFYINFTKNWLDEREFDNPYMIATCLIVTALWVSSMRNEDITQREILEIIGIKDWYDAEDLVFGLNENYVGLDLEAILEIAVSNFDY
jgi:hypothetical protein